MLWSYQNIIVDSPFDFFRCEVDNRPNRVRSCYAPTRFGMPYLTPHGRITSRIRCWSSCRPPKSRSARPAINAAVTGPRLAGCVAVVVGRPQAASAKPPPTAVRNVRRFGGGAPVYGFIAALEARCRKSWHGRHSAREARGEPLSRGIEKAPTDRRRPCSRTRASPGPSPANPSIRRRCRGRATSPKITSTPNQDAEVSR